MLSTESHHQFFISFLLAVLVQHAHVRLTAIERFASFPQPARKTVVNEGKFQDALKGFKDRHLAWRPAFMGDLDILVLGRGGRGGGLFSFRLGIQRVSVRFKQMRDARRFGR